MPSKQAAQALLARAYLVWGDNPLSAEEVAAIADTQTDPAFTKNDDRLKKAVEYVKGGVPVCTVIGFPNGYATTLIKCAEATDAVRNGAAEIDMVVNLGMVKEGRYDDILAEINAVKTSCDGRLLKVIIETCKLTEVEKIALCDVVSRSTADYIKTSTGFGGGGATFHDVELMALHCKGKKVKAAGGIRSIEDAEKFIELGADRLGTSKVVGEVKSILNEKKHSNLSFFS